MECIVCKNEAHNEFSINFEAVPICENCADAIMYQQIQYLRDK